MWFGHECQTTWKNMEMDTEQFRNLQESERYNRYVSCTKIYILNNKSVKGTVSPELRWVLLYINRKLFSRADIIKFYFY